VTVESTDRGWWSRHANQRLGRATRDEFAASGFVFRLETRPNAGDVQAASTDRYLPTHRSPYVETMMRIEVECILLRLGSRRTADDRVTGSACDNGRAVHLSAEEFT